VNITPAQPLDRASIEIYENYKNYEEESFLLSDSGYGDRNRILIFVKGSVRNWINQVENIFVDGTFKLAPKLFAQIFVIMAQRGNYVVPILYAVLPNKKEQAYNRMIQMIIESWPKFHPISLDFEVAVINTFSSAFPNASLQGCLFHLVQNIRRKLVDEGQISRYNKDADFALKMRMIAALAFVPIEELE